jgi:sialic acid synthase SpsE
MEGPDHKASLSPKELCELVVEIRKVEKILGKDKKSVTESEVSNKHIARKYLVAKSDIRVGEQFTPDNLIAKRIGYEGVSPMLWPRIIGQVAKRDLAADEVLLAQDFE